MLQKGVSRAICMGQKASQHVQKKMIVFLDPKLGATLSMAAVINE
jgi:hypothetical protein